MVSSHLACTVTTTLNDTDRVDYGKILPSENAQATLTKTGSQWGDSPNKDLSTKSHTNQYCLSKDDKKRGGL